MNRDIANAIAGTTLATAHGLWYRHTRAGIKEPTGSTGGGRWGPEHGFPVIYLGRPEVSVAVEAYRRLVDPVEGMTGELVGPRTLFTLEVDVDNLLDLRAPDHLAAVGLDPRALGGPWAPCVRVARAAISSASTVCSPPPPLRTGSPWPCSNSTCRPSRVPAWSIAPPGRACRPTRVRRPSGSPRSPGAKLGATDAGRATRRE